MAGAYRLEEKGAGPFQESAGTHSRSGHSPSSSLLPALQRPPHPCQPGHSRPLPSPRPSMALVASASWSGPVALRLPDCRREVWHLSSVHQQDRPRWKQGCVTPRREGLVPPNKKRQGSGDLSLSGFVKGISELRRRLGVPCASQPTADSKEAGELQPFRNLLQPLWICQKLA